MRLIIAEKPSVGRAIVEAIGGQRNERDGYIICGDTAVTWCFGHLLEFAPPSHYDTRWSKWKLDTLPITIPQDAWQLVPREDAKAQLEVIGRLLRRAREVVNAGDPDREGQMLVDEVLDYFRWTGPTQRLLLHDTTAAYVRRALANLKPNREFRCLYQAALCRARADWLVGMNLTRAMSLRIGLTASIGRVQTPTLALIVQRDKEIEAHKTRAFYTLHAHVANARDAIVLSHEPGESQRIFDRAEAERVASALTGRMVEVSVTEEVVTERAPLPHTIGSFQKEAEERFGWSVAQAKAILQRLYEKQYTSYPRTDCPYLPEDHAPKAVPMVRQFIEAGHFTNAAAAVEVMAPSRHVYDNSKVEEHYGLVPTGRVPRAGALSEDELRGWEIITGRFIQSLLPDYQGSVKEARFVYEGRVFKASGETPLNESRSWRLLAPKLGRDKQPVRPLPLGLAGGESATFRVHTVELREGKTTPPKPYTEATLVADMGNVHRLVSDPRLKALLKESAGIGTGATRDDIIETLKLRGYVRLERKTARSKTAYLRSTPFGRYVIEHNHESLTSPGVTGLWEERLAAIAKGEADPGEFMARIEGFVARHVSLIAANEYPPPPAEQPRQEGPRKPLDPTRGGRKSGRRRAGAPRESRLKL